MKLGKLFATLALAAPLVVATPAFADDAWKATASFTYSGQAAIKIVEPKGMKVLFTGSDGKPAEDTLPAVISVANQDAFVPVTFVAEDGSKHTEKFEVKRGQTTEVHVVHTPKGAAAAAPTAAPARKVIGHLVNASAACPNSSGWNARLDFVGKVDGNTAASITIGANKKVDGEVRVGEYDVRVFTDDGKNNFSFYKSYAVTISKDNFRLAWGCDKANPKPIFLAQ